MELTLPDLGENIEEAEVLEVLVRKGDTVAKDQALLELETDKATFELPCPQDGTVSEIHVKKGDTIRVGQRIVTLEAGAPAGDGADRRRPRAVTPPRKRPEPPEEDSEGGREEPARPAARSKAPAREESPEAEARPASRPAGDDDVRDEPADGDRERADAEVAAGPAARRLARELDVNLLRIRGTGSGGRITPEDVQAFVRDRAAAARTAPDTGEPAPTSGKAAPAAAAPAADVQAGAPGERQPLGGIEKAAARHLSASWSEIPHVTHHDLADVTELEESRRRYESGRKDQGPKLTWTALVLKAVAAGLRAFPRFNSTLDAEREELVLRRHIHVAVAVDTEYGLLVPVVHDVDRKTTREIAAEIAGLAERARQRKLARSEMQDAGFTVTNLGGIGGIAFTPIVSRPQVAILGVSRSREEVALREGQAVRRVVLPLSLSYDHRVINGADAARFVRYVAELLEDPLHLLMES
jgi:pyruvate dehydrogenase E2 component (dihydrolipoamide acetyltransferase)